MDVSGFLNRALKHTIEEFPSDCWYTLVKHATGTEKVSAIELVQCGIMVIAWALGKLVSDEPVIGSTGLPEHAEACAELCDALSEDAGISAPAMGFVSDAIYQRVIAMAIAYIVNAASDSEKVQEIFEQVLEWLRVNVMED